MTERTAAGPEPQAPPSMPCPVCKGAEVLTGVLIPLNAFEDDPSGQTKAIVYCPNACHRGRVPGIGQVPAKGNLAQWREKAQELLSDLLTSLLDCNLPHEAIWRVGVDQLLAHILAMPQVPAEPQYQELLEALKWNIQDDDGDLTMHMDRCPALSDIGRCKCGISILGDIAIQQAEAQR